MRVENGLQPAVPFGLERSRPDHLEAYGADSLRNPSCRRLFSIRVFSLLLIARPATAAHTVQVAGAAPEDRPVRLWIEREPNSPENTPFRPAFGSAVAAPGDVDGDGVPDLLVADVRGRKPCGSKSGLPSDGVVWILSGRDGRTLARVQGPPDAVCSQLSAVTLGDIDGDGCSDFAVGWSAGGRKSNGVLRIHSGRSSICLSSLEGPYGFAEFLAGADDVDGDGRADVIVSGGTRWVGDAHVLASIVSSGTGKEISTIPVAEPDERLAAAPLSLDGGFTGGDPLLLLLTTSSARTTLRLRVLSTRDLRVIESVLLPATKESGLWLDRRTLAPWRIDGVQPDVGCLVGQSDGAVWHFSLRTRVASIVRSYDANLWGGGVGMAVAPSIDEDEVFDYWIGTYGISAGEGLMYAISGASGRTLYTFGTEREDVCNLDVNPRAASVAAVGDVDADGVCDVLVGTGNPWTLHQGAAFLVSGRSGKPIFGLARKDEGVRVVRP